MITDWTPERIAQLDDEELSRLLSRYRQLLTDPEKLKKWEAKGMPRDRIDNTIENFEAEIEKRSLDQQKAPRKRRETNKIGIKEDEVNAQLVQVAKEVASSSNGRILVNQLLSNRTGEAKVGGLKNANKCGIDRYITHYENETAITLAAYLPLGQTPDQLYYIVFFPEHLTTDRERDEILRPGIPEEKRSIRTSWGKRYDGFDQAEKLFKKLVAQVTPAIAA